MEVSGTVHGMREVVGSIVVPVNCVGRSWAMMAGFSAAHDTRGVWLQIGLLGEYKRPRRTKQG